MTPSAPPKGFLCAIVRWRRDRRGIAAVEFALVLPILMAFYLGLTEVQPAISARRKLMLVARTLADLTTRSADITKAELKNVFGASGAIMRPFDDTGLTQMVVSSVAVTKIGANYLGTVEWSCGWNLKTTPTSEDLRVRTLLSPATVPEGFKNESTKSFVLVDAQYPYTPTIGYTMTGTVRFKDDAHWPVRGPDRVKPPTGSLPPGMTCNGALL